MCLESSGYIRRSGRKLSVVNDILLGEQDRNWLVIAQAL
jgi:hypothetical protein